MSPAGRPPLSGERKSYKLQVLLTEEERKILDQTAALGGKPTSTWARETLLQLAAFQITQQQPAPRSRKNVKGSN